MAANNAFKLLLEPTTASVGATYTSSSTSNGILTSVLARAALIMILVILVLIFIHFTIKPIFKIKPDSPGIISLPINALTGEDKVYWKTKQAISMLDVRTTPLGSSASGSDFSITIDIQIDDAHAYNNLPRIIFFKGNDLIQVDPSKAAQASIGNMISDASLVFSLTRDTNDLHVSIITENNNTEGVLLYNVPLRNPFRIGVIVSDKRLEVYTNGLLARTRSLSGPPKPVVGYFWPSPTPGIQLRNLHIWPQAITPGEMRAALPALDASQFDVSNLSETASCPKVELSA